MSLNIPPHLQGLNKEEVQASRLKYGANQIDTQSSNAWIELLWDIVKDPLLILLFAVTLIYFIIGDYAEAVFMLLAIIAVSAISFYQDSRSKKALEELKKLNEPLSTVIRNAQVLQIPTHELVVGDLCITEEGKMINADGSIVHSNDFSVNESALTGESFSVFKDKDTEDNKVYSGTLTVSGLAVFEIEKVGAQTEIGGIGTAIAQIKEEKSHLQVQIADFVKKMALIGALVFVLVCVYSYFQTGDVLQSLLNGLTLAMSILPEEIPVAFTTFMALGAWKLMKEGIIIKRSAIVETLGSTTVICTDKTGTITQNIMELKHLYLHTSGQLYSENEFKDKALKELIEYAMWASEPVPFNPMEVAVHEVYLKTNTKDKRNQYQMVFEYPLSGRPPMMTHVLENKTGHQIIATKGAVEAILAVCHLPLEQEKQIQNQANELGTKGYRVLAVAKAEATGRHLPEQQQQIDFDFLGLLVFYDPPKEGIQEVFGKIYEAGIQVKVITGDQAATTQAIVSQAGILSLSEPADGKEVLDMPEEELSVFVEDHSIFTRMFPEAKLRLIQALKKDGEVVAMLGDGVNDGPALKAAHIGVAMGEKGTEIAKTAADLVLTNDDLDKLITGIAAGRRIYANIKKAIQYIISIHIPIILTVSLPLFLGWIYPQIFTPVHVIFMELIMGPICSIVYESEPMEENAMEQKPRKMTDTFLSGKELSLSIVQGLMITIGVLFAYQYAVSNSASEEITRAMVFSTLIFANILLSFANRSFYYSMFFSLKHKNNLLVLVTFLTIILLFCILYIPVLSRFFAVNSLSLSQLLISVGIAFLAVGWFEIYKFISRRKTLSFES